MKGIKRLVAQLCPSDSKDQSNSEVVFLFYFLAQLQNLLSY
jgi:hypothetical protein